MKRLTLRLAVAGITFAVGTAAASGWHVGSRAEVVLDESPAGREFRRAFQEGLTAEVPFCELVKYPKVYENRRLRVLMSFEAGGNLSQTYFSAWCQGEAEDAIFIEYESERTAAEAGRLFAEAGRGMDDCWRGNGIVIGSFESSDGEGYGPQKNLPHRFVVSRLEPPHVYFCGQE